MAQLADIELALQLRAERPDGISTAVNLTTRDYGANWTEGTGDGQVDLILHGSVTTTASGAQVDLMSFTDLFGVTQTFSFLRLVVLVNTGAESGNVRADYLGNEYLPWMVGIGGEGHLIKAGSFVAIGTEDEEYTVDATHHLVLFQNGSGETTFDYWFAGVST